MLSHQHLPPAPADLWIYQTPDHLLSQWAQWELSFQDHKPSSALSREGQSTPQMLTPVSLQPPDLFTLLAPPLTHLRCQGWKLMFNSLRPPQLEPVPSPGLPYCGNTWHFASPEEGRLHSHRSNPHSFHLPLNLTDVPSCTEIIHAYLR